MCSDTQHHSTTQHHTAPRSTTQHHAAPRSTTQHHAAPRSTIWYLTVLHHHETYKKTLTKHHKHNTHPFHISRRPSSHIKDTKCSQCYSVVQGMKMLVRCQRSIAFYNFKSLLSCKVCTLPTPISSPSLLLPSSPPPLLPSSPPPLLPSSPPPSSPPPLLPSSPPPLGWYDIIWYDMIWCDMMWCDVMWCDVMWCDVMWCDVMWCDVIWCTNVRYSRILSAPSLKTNCWGMKRWIRKAKEGGRGRVGERRARREEDDGEGMEDGEARKLWCG